MEGVLPDAVCLARSLTDPSAFGPIFDRHFVSIHRYLHRRAGRDLADELAAETFALAFERRASCRSEDSVLPRLYGIATNLLRRRRRTEVRRLRAYGRSGVDPSVVYDDGDDAAIRADTSSAGAPLARALAAMRIPSGSTARRPTPSASGDNTGRRCRLLARRTGRAGKSFDGKARGRRRVGIMLVDAPAIDHGLLVFTAFVVRGLAEDASAAGAFRGSRALGLDFERTRSSMVDGMAEPERPARTLSIADAAESSGLSAHTLRYYEREGLLEPVGRNGSGHRRYRETDLELIAFLAKLRATGMPIREVRRYAELMRAGDTTNTERLELLEAHRDAVLAGLEATTRNLELIDWKVGFYREKTGVDKEGV